MTTLSAAAIAHPNIALIKYWGNRDDFLRLPSNGSISMNLAGLFTRTQVSFAVDFKTDSLEINGKEMGSGLERVTQFLDLIRKMAGVKLRAKVQSENNFPTGAGIASSASAFASLSLAGSKALGLDLDERALSRLARRGSGSACRSVPGGFVEWLPGEKDADSFAVSLAPAEHWDLVDCVAVVTAAHKAVGSTEGHALAGTSPLQGARVADAPRRLTHCRRAVIKKDFDELSEIVELDSDMMHAVMMTSNPALFYWEPATLQLMQAVRSARRGGLAVCYTLDAGPNVHVLCQAGDEQQVQGFLLDVPDVINVLTARPGGPTGLAT